MLFCRAKQSHIRPESWRKISSQRSLMWQGHTPRPWIRLPITIFSPLSHCLDLSFPTWDPGNAASHFISVLSLPYHLPLPPEQNDVEATKATPVLNSAKSDGPLSSMAAAKPSGGAPDDPEMKRMMTECKRLQMEMSKMAEENMKLKVGRPRLNSTVQNASRPLVANVFPMGVYIKVYCWCLMPY